MKMKEKVLITGGSGLIGRKLTDLLLQQSYEVMHLSRSKNNNTGVKTFLWNYETGFIEDGALEKIDHIVHLAGENIGGGRWTKARKKKILESRIKSTELLFTEIKKKNSQIKSFISASGISVYGTRTVEQIFNEENTPEHSSLTNDFAAEVVFEWEKSADLFSSICRVVKIRTGIVLDIKGGALKKMYTPVKWKIGSALGSGKQFIPWIHIDDICNMYLFALKNSVSGAFNGVSGESVTNKQFTKILGKVSGNRVWLPNVPVFLLRILFGEMASIVLEGSRISNEKIKKEGFVFKYETLDPALKSFFK